MLVCAGLKRGLLVVVAVVAGACGAAVPADETPETGSSSTGAAGSTSQDPATTAPPSTSSATVTTDAPGGESSSSTGGVPDPCSIWAQDCPEGFKCAPYSNNGGGAWNDTMCVPVAEDPAGYGEPCTVQESGVSGLDDCDVGALCFGVDPQTLMGECVELCGGTPEEPTCVQDDATCIISSDGTVAPCLLSCDPLGGECDPDEVCVPSNSGSFVCTADASEDGGAVGDPCEFINACDEGLGCYTPIAIVCTDETASGCCLPYCSLAAPDCPDALTCVPYWESGDAPEGYENLGLCHEPL